MHLYVITDRNGALKPRAIIFRRLWHLISGNIVVKLKMKVCVIQRNTIKTSFWCIHYAEKQLERVGVSSIYTAPLLFEIP